MARSLVSWQVGRYSGSVHFRRMNSISEGTRPVLVVSDVSFLRKVFIHQFSKFHGRHIPLLTHILGRDRLHIFASSADQWRRHRHILAPGFSAMKLKKMSSKIQACIQTFIHRTTDGEIDAFLRMKQFALDVICKFSVVLCLAMDDAFCVQP